MDLGSLGKSRVISELIKKGYDVFTEFDGKSPFDLVAHFDGELFKVEVKSTKTRTKYDTGWAVQIKSVRPNNKENRIVNFSSSSCDLLAIYIEPIDKVLIIPSSEIRTKTVLTILDNDFKLES